MVALGPAAWLVSVPRPADGGQARGCGGSALRTYLTDVSTSCGVRPGAVSSPPRRRQRESAQQSADPTRRAVARV